MSNHRSWQASSLLLIVSLGVAPAYAQEVTEAGIARDAKLGTPLECLHVALLDSTGRAIAHTVTDAAGQFQLDASRPGVYRVQFTVKAWEPLAGPVDTLHESEFRQRAYPLDFRLRLMPDSSEQTRVAKGWSDERYRRERYRKLYAYLDSTQSDSVWRSARPILRDIEIQYPEKLRADEIEGQVLGQLIVDSSGTARRDSWRTLGATHPDFDNAVRGTLPASRWIPAHIRERSVCELIYDYTSFYFDGGIARIHFETR